MLQEFSFLMAVWPLSLPIQPRSPSSTPPPTPLALFQQVHLEAEPILADYFFQMVVLSFYQEAQVWLA
jgi:hypothetical protein